MCINVYNFIMKGKFMNPINASYSNYVGLKNNPQAPQEPQTAPAPKPNMNSTDTVSFTSNKRSWEKSCKDWNLRSGRRCYFRVLRF